METIPEKPKRVKLVVFVDPTLRLRLKAETIRTDRPGGSIVEEALRHHFSIESPHTPIHSS